MLHSAFAWSETFIQVQRRSAQFSGSDMGQYKLLIAVGHGRKSAQVHFPVQKVRTARHHQSQW